MDIIEILNKSIATPEEVQIVFKKHKELFPNIRLCANCPSVVRAAFNRLKQHYESK